MGTVVRTSPVFTPYAGKIWYDDDTTAFIGGQGATLQSAMNQWKAAKQDGVLAVCIWFAETATSGVRYRDIVDATVGEGAIFHMVGNQDPEWYTGALKKLKKLTATTTATEAEIDAAYAAAFAEPEPP